MAIINSSKYELLDFIECNENDLSNYKNITGAGVIFNVDGKFLVGYNNWRLQWEIPAGGIDKGEVPSQTALRELYEETHQKTDYLDFVGLFKKKRPNGEIVYNAIYYCEQEKIAPFIKQDDDENDEIKLWNIDNDNENIDLIDLEIIKKVKSIKCNKIKK